MDGRRRQLIEAVALALFLADARRRRALISCCSVDEADQRRQPDLCTLAARLADLPAALVGDGNACRDDAERLVETAAGRGIAAVAWHDPVFPPRLTAVDDPPAVLWLRGDPAALAGPAVALVGSRAASPYAIAVAEGLGTDLARRGVIVISGLARGVDAAAHRGALAGPGRTVAVLGCGVDIVYPAEHAELSASIVERGAVVSELGPGTPPLAHHFPRRNRLISGLALAVVVVEARARSGSLITARCAADQGREVMAVPGNVLSGRSRGAHALIRDGAKIVETADDILEELGGRVEPAPGAGSGPPLVTRDPVLGQMDLGETYDLEALAARSGLGSIALLARLTDLELEGRIARVGAGRFVRVSREVVT